LKERTMAVAITASRTEIAKDILRTLISFDTVSAKPNLPLAEWVRDYLTSHGVEVHMLPAEDGIHANLFATIGPQGASGIGLSGHMDVVPVTGQPWDTDPFEMVERDGRLYGRGTCDMKGYLACVLAMVPEFKARALATPIHIVFSYDEEVGCTGVKPMIAEFGGKLPKPRIVVVGEPTNMTVVDAHKGGSRFITEVIGKDAHSSKPQLGVGAIRIAGELIHELGRIEARYKAEHPNPRFDPPYASITVSSIEGGIAHNILPPLCRFRWGVRTLPGITADNIAAELQAYAERELLPAMRAISPECDIITRRVSLLPAFSSGEGSEATSVALKLAGQNETFAVSYGTEASHFEASGSSTVVIGPGSIDQAHKPNEYVEIVELEKCVNFLEKVADWAKTTPLPSN
ncbi:MAG: acetylornithine deacetylase, partial [Hyphomicrobiaceae bacterium]